jgi:hypothetical protein
MPPADRSAGRCVVPGCHDDQVTHHCPDGERRCTADCVCHRFDNPHVCDQPGGWS